MPADKGVNTPVKFVPETTPNSSNKVYVYGAIPPLAVTVTAPSAPPLQEVESVLET